MNKKDVGMCLIYTGKKDMNKKVSEFDFRGVKWIFRGGGELKGVGGNKRGVEGKFRGVEGKLEELYGYV